MNGNKLKRGIARQITTTTKALLLHTEMRETHKDTRAHKETGRDGDAEGDTCTTAQMKHRKGTE